MGLPGQQRPSERLRATPRSWPTSPLHHCTARGHRKSPARKQGQVGSIMRACRPDTRCPLLGRERAQGIGGKPTAQRGRRIIGCTPHGDAHTKKPHRGGAKSLATGLAEMRVTANWRSLSLVLKKNDLMAKRPLGRRPAAFRNGRERLGRCSLALPPQSPQT